jgi:hypothetical protein
MFALIALGVLLLVLIAGLGLPYPQTWHGRWGTDGYERAQPRLGRYVPKLQTLPCGSRAANSREP